MPLLIRSSARDAATFEIRWDLLPTFITVRGDLQVKLAHELNRFYDSVPLDQEAQRRVHNHICAFLEEAHPGYAGLAEWLQLVERVVEPA